MRVALLDYGAGNLHSLAKALALSGADVRMESDPSRCLDADTLVLPGVGSFSRAAEHIAPARAALRAAILQDYPVIGVCLGMQLLFDSSEEGRGEGLGVIPGTVTRIDATRVPQIGWNTLDDATDPAVAASRLRAAYYANSFVCRPRNTGDVRAWTTHECDRFPAVVRSRRAVGVQFHPEKSSVAGVRLLRVLLEECRS
ncbi:MAG: imidazole glycerol phosphate synthase subunit HisH [Gemmatimonadaceae bacterium]